MGHNANVIKTWKPIHTKILTLVAQGRAQEEIAKAVGRTQTTISQIVNTPHFQEKLARMENNIIDKTADKFVDDIVDKKVRDKLRNAAPIAVEELLKFASMECADAKQMHVKLAACKDILDRSGYRMFASAVSSDRDYTPEETRAMKKTIEEMQYLMTRLSNQQSPFILKKGTQGQRIHAVSVTMDRSSESSSTDDGSIETIPDRQETRTE